MREIRNAAGTSQSELAEVLGSRKSVISMIESGQRGVSVEVLVSIADYFNVSIDYLVGRSDDPERHAPKNAT